VPGLGASFGRGAATTYQQDLANSDCILIMGSNMAEAHPVGFRWPMIRAALSWYSPDGNLRGRVQAQASRAGSSRRHCAAMRPRRDGVASASQLALSCLRP